MAPWPEPQGDEPKAPDKSNNNPDETTSTREEGAAAKEDIEVKVAAAEDPLDPSTSDNVSDLNDGELKALLDEAISYKSPKDRHGKSNMFNELLKKAETAEEEGGPENSLLFPETRYGLPKRRSGRKEKGISVSERQSHCRSLQNINQCHQGDPASQLGRRHGPHQFRRGASTSSTCSSVTSESVSTRQREGGSLPCSVNEVQLINFTQGDYNGDSLEDLRLRWGSGLSMHKLPANQETSTRSSPKPAISPIEMITFESRSADESLDSEPSHSERKEARSIMTQSLSQDLEQEKQAVMEKANLLAKQEEQREMAASSYKNSVNLEVNKKEPEEVDRQPTLFNDKILKQADGNLGLPDAAAVTSVLSEKSGAMSNSLPCKPMLQQRQFLPATRLASTFGPKVDENENMSSSHSEASNALRKKSKKKQHHDASVPSEKIEGYVGDKDLDYLIKYIGEEQKIKGSKLSNDLKYKEIKETRDATANRRNQRYSEDGKKEQQKNAKVGRKGAGETGRNKMKRANSLEEVSKSKLEDLTIQPYCRSIGGEDRTSEASKDLDDDEEYNRLLDEQNGNLSVKSEDFQGNLTGSDFPDLYSDTNPIPNEDSLEFQTVTNSKKQRRKKQKVRQDDRTGRHSYIRGGGVDYEEDHYPHHHHHHYSHHPPSRRKLKSTCSVPPSDQSGGDSSDCDSVHSLPVSHVATNSDPTTKSYAAIARNPPPPPAPALPDPKGAVEEWPQVVEKADLETASSSVSSTTTEPNTPPEESLNVLHDYYPSLAESVKGSRKPSEEQQPKPPASLPNGDIKQQRFTAKAASPPAPRVACKPPLPTTCQAPKRVIHFQPPVIFDEKTLCSDSVEGLTFGFSVNPSLMDEVGPLTPDCAPTPTQPLPPHVPLAPKPPPGKQQSPPITPSSAAATTGPLTTATPITTAPAGESDLPTSKKTRDFAAMFRAPPQPQTDAINQLEIINFIGSTWGLILHELKNKESPNSRSIQYYSAEC